MLLKNISKIKLENLKHCFYSRYDSLINIIPKYFDLKSVVKVSISSNFLKGSFIVNNGWKIFEEEYKGLYFTENTLYLSANPLKGIFEYWRVKIVN